MNTQFYPVPEGNLSKLLILTYIFILTFSNVNIKVNILKFKNRETERLNDLLSITYSVKPVFQPR